MEDFGDILFYIIAAVIGLVTTLGKKKKKKPGIPVPAKTEPVEDQDESPVFEEIEDLDYQVDNQDFVLEEDVDFEPVIEGGDIEPITVRFKDEGKAQFAEKAMMDNEDEDDTEISSFAQEELSGKEEEEDILSDFDLRKAVIFSEILDRKDY